MRFVVVGAGAIGGTVGARLVRDGHDVLFCDADAEHVAAMNEHGLVIDPATQTVALQGRPLTLTGAEFALLTLLARHRGKILSRDRIMEETRGVDWEAYDRSIDVLVSRLRQKLGDDVKRPAFIRTIRGRGYLFTGGDA